MASWLGFGTKETAPAVAEKKTAKALPAAWYRSEAMYQLERRAIYSKKWILVSHKLRYTEPGSYLQMTQAGYPLFLVKDRAGNINAFHNVCRHRAYPVVEGGSGKASILACKYHGWSYGFNGKLAKAPKYQDLDTFDKAANSLFPIHIHVDKLGYVWINLESSPEPSVSWEEDFSSVDEQARLAAFDMSQFKFDHQWEMMGDYNWKTLADNYNECYHCLTGHPGVSAVTNLDKYWVETKGGHIQHFNTDRPDKEGLGIYSTYLYPNTSITISTDFMYIMRCIPVSATRTKMEYEVYRGLGATDEKFTEISEFFKQVLREDKDLCNAAHKNLQGGIFVNGELHPQAEKGPLYFQRLTRDLVMSHRAEEKRTGKDSWPAAPQHDLSSKSEEEVDFCRQLDCDAAKDAGLEW